MLFSAYAEVFLITSIPESSVPAFLCLRRGVSKLFDLDGLVTNFSLPTQRCFPIDLTQPVSGGLFSAYAEVFLSPSRYYHPRLAFLCLRRGVSSTTSSPRSTSPFSLPTQRCF